MASSFFGINVATSGLAAQKLAMEVLSQNIAHANDPSYKRQRLMMSEGMPLAQSQDAGATGSTMVSTGVLSGAIQRVRDSLIEHRLQLAGQSSAQYEFMTKILSQLEAVLGEPSDTGLQDDLDTFWESWSNLANDPSSGSLRTTLLENTEALCARIQYVNNQFISSIDDLNLSARNSIDTINQMAEEIARIDSEVSALSGGSFGTNDLLNRRDALVQDLSKLASVSTFGEGGGDFVVTLGGRILVQGVVRNELKTDIGADGNQTIQWASDGQDAIIQGGELRALLDLRDNLIPNYLSQLTDFTTSLVQEVNTLHHTGKTMDGTNGGDFFMATSGPGNVALDASIYNQPRLIAAASVVNAIGDGNIAAAIAKLQEMPIGATGMTVNEMYRALVGDIGGASSMAQKQANAHNLSLQEFTTQQQSISGVSLDEEMTNMIKFQQAYNASARLLTVMDDMLGVIIDKTGLGGR